jgi:hypothetical protein
VANPETAWPVVDIHHVAFAHGCDDTPRRVTDLLGVSVAHCESALGFVERMVPAGDAYLQFLEAAGPGDVDCNGLLAELVAPAPAGPPGPPDSGAGRS